MIDRLYTLGHSNRELEEFLELLDDADIETLVDVRTYPSSRRFPWFNEGNLEESLTDQGLQYVHLASLGGLRDEPDPDPTLEGLPERWRPYAAHMQSELFADGYDRLAELAARQGLAAVMCAEREPEDCHRQFIADRVVLDSGEAIHLIRPGESRPHEIRETAEFTDDGTVVYRSDQKSLSF